MLRCYAAALMSVVPAVAAADEIGYSRCVLTVNFPNDIRRVPGAVNAECGSFSFHNDQGYGNWGVDSNHGRRRDAFQFAGWKWRHNKRQWQSCTNENPPPNCHHYNDAGCTKQKANPERQYGYGGYSQYGPRDMPCEDWVPGAITINGVYMQLYELDKPDADDFITSLGYHDMSLPPHAAVRGAATAQRHGSLRPSATPRPTFRSELPRSAGSTEHPACTSMLRSGQCVL